MTEITNAIKSLTVLSTIGELIAKVEAELDETRKTLQRLERVEADLLRRRDELFTKDQEAA